MKLKRIFFTIFSVLSTLSLIILFLVFKIVDQQISYDKSLENFSKSDKLIEHLLQTSEKMSRIARVIVVSDDFEQTALFNQIRDVFTKKIPLPKKYLNGIRSLNIHDLEKYSETYLDYKVAAKDFGLSKMAFDSLMEIVKNVEIIQKTCDSALTVLNKEKNTNIKNRASFKLLYNNEFRANLNLVNSSIQNLRLVIHEDNQIENSVHEIYRKDIILLLFLMIFIMLMLEGLIFNYVIKRIIKPIMSLKDAAEKISLGDSNVTLNINSKNEIGSLADSFHKLILYFRDLSEAMQKLAKGEFTTTFKPKSEEDLLGNSFLETNYNLENLYEKFQLLNFELERKVIERTEELDKERLLMVTLYNSAPEIIYYKDIHGVYQFVNTEFEKLYGKNKSEIVGKSTFDILDKEISDNIISSENFVIQTGISHNSQEWIKNHENKDLLMEVSKIPIFSNEGYCLGILGILRDISEKYEAETALHLFSYGMDNAADAIFWINPEDATLIQTNQTTAEFLQYTKEELLGMKLDKFDINFQDELWRQSVNIINSGKSLEFNSIYRRKDGSTFSGECTISYLEFRGKGYIVNITRDVTKRKEFEKLLADSEEYSKLILDTSGEGIIGVDSNGVCTFVNHFSSKLLGYTKEELVGKKIHGIIHHSHIDGKEYFSKECPVKETLKSGVFHKVSTEVFWKKSGEYFQVEYSSFPIVRNDEIVGAVLTFNDITQELKAQEEIQRSKKLAELIIDSSPIPIALTTVNDGTILKMNKAMAEFHLVDHSAIQYMKTTSWYINPNDRLPLVQKMQNQGYLSSFPIKLKRYGTGEVRDCLLSFTPLIFEGESTLVGAIIDVTESKLAEEELKKLSMALDQSPVTVIITNTTGVIEYVNPHFENVTGYFSSEAIGRTLSIVKSGYHDNLFYKELWEKLLNGLQWHGEFCNKRKDGSLYWELTSISPVRNSSNIITHYIAVKEDISTIKKIQEELISHENLTTGTAHAVTELITNHDTLSAIRNSLKIIGQSTNHDKCYIFENNKLIDGTLVYSQKFEYLSYEVFKQNDYLHWVNVPYDKEFIELIDMFNNNDTIDSKMLNVIDEMNKRIKENLDNDFNDLLDLFNSVEMTSKIVDQDSENISNDSSKENLYIIPIFQNNIIWGFLGLDSYKKRIYTEKEKSIFLAYANTLSAIITRDEDQKSIRTNQENLRNVLESNPTGLAIVDFESNEVLLNNMALNDIFEYEFSAGIEFDIMESISINEDRRYFAIKFWEDGKILNVESQFKKFNSDRIFWAVFSIIPLSYLDREAALFSIVDVTDMKNLQLDFEKSKQIAEEATKAKSDFLANMSHEIRTPMNAIIGLSHLALKTNLEPKQKDYLLKIERSGQSLLGIINDILDFSKIEAGKLSIENVEFNLETVLDTLSNVVTYKAQEKNLEIVIASKHDVPLKLIGDPLRIGQVLINLSSNAVKFTEKGDIIIKVELLGLKSNKCQLKFSVTDTGIGLTEEQISKLFQSFSQADSSTTRKFGGTGLGLSISKKLVELMNGNIWVESVYGKGSSFMFTAEFEIPENYKQESFLPSLDLRGLRVLICDDNETSREVLRDSLESFTFNVTEVSSGLDAIREIEENQANPYELILIDWNMPDLDGLKTSELIINNHKLSKVPIIIMVSAYNREELIDQAINIGLQAFLTKPVGYSLLFDTVMNVFGKDIYRGSKLETQSNKYSDNLFLISGANILLAEDNEINQQVASELFESVGFKIEIANNGAEVLKLINRNVPEYFDIIIMDLQMPIMDGYMATKEVRKNDKFNNIPIVAMTADAMSGVKENCIEIGMNDFITKPINPEEVFKILLKWIKPKLGKKEAKTIITNSQVKEVFIPEITGIDINDGLSRINNNRALFYKLLKKFHETNINFKETLLEAYNTGDFETAERTAHTVKGVAGNIGAKKLFITAGILENRLRESLVNDIEKEADELMKVLKPILNDIEKEILIPEGLISKPAESDTIVSVVDKTLLLVHFEKLIEMLDDGDFESINKIDEIMQITDYYLKNELLKVMKNAENYNYEIAKEMMEELKTKILGETNE